MTLRLPRNWPVLLIALPAAVAIWGGWVGLGAKAGFGPVNLLPGIGHGLTLNTAITLPVGVEAYGSYAIGAWLAPATPALARRFARASAIGSLALGMSGQVAYHLLAAAHDKRAPGLVIVLVACLPVVTLGFAAALTHLLRAGEVPSQEPRKVPAEVPAKAAKSATAGAAKSASEVPSGGPRKEPSQEPQGEPRRPAARTSKGPDAESARAAYRKSARPGGSPLTDRALGEMFGRSRTWGAARIREVEGGPKLAEVTAP